MIYEDRDIIQVLEKSFDMLKRFDETIKDMEKRRDYLKNKIEGVNRPAVAIVKLNMICNSSIKLWKEAKTRAIEDGNTLVSLLHSVLHGEPLKFKEMTQIKAIESRIETINGIMQGEDSAKEKNNE